MKDNRISELIKHYNLMPHPEGGYFKERHNSENYGNCLFLLANNQIDYLHKLDCDEMWYFHEGCGMIIYTINENKTLNKLFFGNDISKKQTPFITFKKGTIFGAENIDKSSYTFLTCLTVPKFRYGGFKIIKKEDINIQIDDRLFKQY